MHTYTHICIYANTHRYMQSLDDDPIFDRVIDDEYLDTDRKIVPSQNKFHHHFFYLIDTSYSK